MTIHWLKAMFEIHNRTVDGLICCQFLFYKGTVSSSGFLFASLSLLYDDEDGQQRRRCSVTGTPSITKLWGMLSLASPNVPLSKSQLPDTMEKRRSERRCDEEFGANGLIKTEKTVFLRIFFTISSTGVREKL